MSADLPEKGKSPTSPLPPKAAGKALIKPMTENLFDDLQVSLDVRLGQAVMTIGEIRRLKPDAIIPLDIKLDEHATVEFKGAVIARGEIVAVDDSFGLRIVEIAPMDAP